MATQSDDPRALVPSFMPPVVTLVYPGQGAAFESSGEWSRIAAELEEQEKQKEKEDSSSASDIKLFRVDQFPRPFTPEAEEDDGEPMRWLFPISDDLIKNERFYNTEAPPGTVLEAKMADEIDSLYRLYGMDEVVRLGDSINSAYLANLKAFDEAYADGTREKNEQFDKRTDVLAAVRMVSSVYGRQLGALRDRIKEHQKQVTEAAAKIAAAKIQEAGVEILTEATRYVPLARKHTVSAQRALETDGDLTNFYLAGGPDTPALLEAVARIRSRMEAVDNPPPAKPELFGLLNPLATSPAEDAAHALEIEISLACQRFPILHRTWKTLRFTRYADNMRKVFSALRSAWSTNRRMQQRIVNEPEVVWLFPPLIHETLEKLAEENPEFGDLGVGARAAQELLEESASRITEQLAKIAGFLDLAVALTSPAPPIALSFAGASLVFSLADSLLEYQQLSAQDDAANSVLDPRKALCSDPSYGFFALGIALSLLDLRGMRNAYRAARVTREVDELGKLVQEGL